jgi:hypothetical protein
MDRGWGHRHSLSAALAAFTLAALVAAFALASSASATALCKTSTSPCGSKYGVGTVVELKSTGLPLITNPWTVRNECRNVVVKGEVTNAGGLGVNVSGAVSGFVVPECNLDPVTVFKKGTFSINHTGGDNGTMVLEGFELEEGWTNCVFGGPFSIGLSGGAMASAEPTSSLVKITGLCPETATWDIKFTVMAPEPLYVKLS